MSTNRFITRKEIAMLIEESPDLVRQNEERWGLAKCRAGFKRPVKYWRERAIALLRQCGVVE